MNKRNLILLVIIVASINLYSQTFEVEFNETKGALTKTDKFKSDFGRYDGYEIPLYQGEAVNFVVYSDNFSPKLVFVDPSGKVFKQSAEVLMNTASIITIIPESGDWILFIVSDSSSLGEYTFQYALASANSLSLPDNSDFCTTLNYILAHAKAFYLLFENPVDSKNAFVKLPNSSDAFIDENDGSYNATLYDGNDIKEAEKLFKDVSDDIIKCLGKDWSAKKQTWEKVEDYKVKSNVLTEKIKEKSRYVKIMLMDLKDSREKFMNDYSVQVLINRNH